MKPSQAYLDVQPVDYIINCAAYTDVDGPNRNQNRAMQLNRDVLSNLEEILEDYPDTRIIHISTDYIFQGDILRPLREDDPADPVSVYGKTKLEGEKVLQDHPRAIVIRPPGYSVFSERIL